MGIMLDPYTPETLIEKDNCETAASIQIFRFCNRLFDVLSDRI